jgi:hypothetical protein
MAGRDRDVRSPIATPDPAGFAGLAWAGACLSAVAVVAAGCGGSDYTETHALILHTNVFAAGDGSANVRTIGAPCGAGETGEVAIVPAPGDRMFVSVDGVAFEMEGPLHDRGGNPFWETTVHSVAEGTLFELRFIRPNFDDPPVARIRLPAPFEIISESPSGPVSRSEDDIEVRWEPSGTADSMMFTAEENDCFALMEGSLMNSLDVPDEGLFVIPATSVQGLGTCELTLDLDRWRQSREPDCGEGVLYAAQTRPITFMSTP